MQNANTSSANTSSRATEFAVILSAALGAAVFLSHTANYDKKALKEYRDHFHSVDVYAAGGIRHGLGAPVLGQEIISPRAYAETELYRDWSRKLEIFYLVGATFAVTPSEIGMLGIHRSQNAAAFNEDDKRLVGCFLPHLQRAMQIRHRLAEARIAPDAALAALERSAIATIVAARHRRAPSGIDPRHCRHRRRAGRHG